MSADSHFTDLPAQAFLILRNAFFNDKTKPLSYHLRQKRNTQDDPFDEYVHTLLSKRLPGGIVCKRASGPLITPDLGIMRPDMCSKTPRKLLTSNPALITGMEVKKLERTRGGTIARASGMDYNTTPPCGIVRVYDPDGVPVDIPGFYLFVCQESVEGRSNRYRLTALTLCDGNLLNADFEYYLSIVGERTKKVGLGTYSNGADRNRPMLIFGNPLGISELDRNVTFVHSRNNMEREFPQLRKVGIIRRTISRGSKREFHCYRVRNDVSKGFKPFELTDPFPTPTRTEGTQPRGRFRIDIIPPE